jgi:hypothetical protein
MPSLRTLPRDLALFAKYHLVRRPAAGPEPETDLGVVPLGLDLDAYVETIRGYGGRFEVSTLDEIVYGGRRHPILAVRTAPAAARRVLLVAGIHGNEHAGLLAVPELLNRIAGGAAGASEVELCAVTPANPVGAAHLSRYNGEGLDVNRDFARFETREARALRGLFDALSPDFVVSLHEGPQDATFFFANQRVERTLALALLGAIEAGGSALARHDYFGRTLRPPGYAPMSTAAWTLSFLWAAALRMKAMNMYAGDRGVPEITIESSWRLPDREARVRAHVDLVLALLRELARAR